MAPKPPATRGEGAAQSPTSGEPGLCTPSLGGPGPSELGGGELSEPSLGPPAEAQAASAAEPTEPHRFPRAPQAFPLPPGSQTGPAS